MRPNSQVSEPTTTSQEPEVFNPLIRALFEKRVHDFISEGNDKLIEAGLVHSLRKLRAQGL